MACDGHIFIMFLITVKITRTARNDILSHSGFGKSDTFPLLIYEIEAHTKT